MGDQLVDDGWEWRCEFGECEAEPEADDSPFCAYHASIADAEDVIRELPGYFGGGHLIPVVPKKLHENWDGYRTVRLRKLDYVRIPWDSVVYHLSAYGEMDVPVDPDIDVAVFRGRLRTRLFLNKELKPYSWAMKTARDNKSIRVSRRATSVAEERSQREGVAVAMYLDGASYTEIRKRVGRSRDWVGDLVERRNLPRRPMNQKKRAA